jgi:hypothetical protein
MVERASKRILSFLQRRGVISLVTAPVPRQGAIRRADAGILWWDVTLSGAGSDARGSCAGRRAG